MHECYIIEYNIVIIREFLYRKIKVDFPMGIYEGLGLYMCKIVIRFLYLQNIFKIQQINAIIGKIINLKII